jgi:hypothetical protein
MRRPILAALLIVLLALVPWSAGTLYVHLAGREVTGEIASKQERIVLPGGDAWQHLYEVTYRFRPADSPATESGGHPVAATLYDRLQVGSAVRVRYSPWRPLRSMQGVGSYLAESGTLTRLRYGPIDHRNLLLAGGVVGAALVGWLAYRRMSVGLGILAALLAGLAFPSFLLVLTGFLLIPALWRASRRSPSMGHGKLLLLVCCATAALVYWRIPRPAQFPPGPVRQASAIVRQVQTTREIWSQIDALRRGEGGDAVGFAFQMLDLEFKPEGAREAVHALDMVDQGSMPGLREGTRVAVTYSATNPRVARAAVGTRKYPMRAFEYLVGITYGAGALLALVILPALRAVRRLLSSLQRPGSLFAAFDNASRLSRLSPDEARQRVLELLQHSRERTRWDQRSGTGPRELG